MKAILIMCLLLLMSGGVFAGLLEGQLRENIIELALSSFWGNAIMSDGSKVKPANEKERNTLPIAKQDAYDVVAVGEISGLSEWCGLPWRRRYLKLTQSARSGGLRDKQVAFIGMLHGVAQGFIVKQRSKHRCTKTQRNRVRGLIQDLPKRIFKWNSSR